MSDKTLYTLIVHSENIAGLLNQITAVFTRRQINIESLNVSASSIKGVHKYTCIVPAYNPGSLRIGLKLRTGYFI